MTTTEIDGFVTVPPRKRFGRQYEDAGFRVWQELNTGASFYAMLAYKHGSAEDLQKVRDRLANAIAIIDAAQTEKGDAA